MEGLETGKHNEEYLEVKEKARGRLPGQMYNRNETIWKCYPKG